MKTALCIILLAGSALAAEKQVEVTRSVQTVRIVREFDSAGKLVKERTEKEHRFVVLVDGQEVQLPAQANSRAALMVALRTRFGSGNQYRVTDRTRRNQ
jgi:hypothetical protein